MMTFEDSNGIAFTATMTSYAAVAATPAPHMNGSHKPSLTNDLFLPPPESMTLYAALTLLEPPDTQVYLMSRDWLENWVRWAYQQPVIPSETDRVRKALKLVAEAHEFDLSNPEYCDPGPIDNRELSIPGHPLLLRPEIQVGEPQSALSQRALRRVVSFNGISNGHGNPTDQGAESDDKVQCCVVQEKFFEVGTEQSLLCLCV